jgi:hypothetical protein
MAGQFIRDAKGHVTGRIVESKFARTGYDANGRRVGDFKKRTNITYDKDGHVAASAGDTLSDLLGKAKKR